MSTLAYTSDTRWPRRSEHSTQEVEILGGSNPDVVFSHLINAKAAILLRSLVVWKGNVWRTHGTLLCDVAKGSGLPDVAQVRLVSESCCGAFSVKIPQSQRSKSMFRPRGLNLLLSH